MDEDRRAKPTDQPPAADGRHGRESKGGRIVERRKSEKWEGVTYQLSYNVDPDTGKRRGPYWRAHFHNARTGRSTSRYIGKTWRELREDEF